jgi:hypothetical protein
MLTQC